MGWWPPKGISGSPVHLMTALDGIFVPKCLRCHTPAWGGTQRTSAALLAPRTTGGSPLALQEGWEWGGALWQEAGCTAAGWHPPPRLRASPFLSLVDDVTDLHVEGPVLALQGAICSLLCGGETTSYTVWGVLDRQTQPRAGVWCGTRREGPERRRTMGTFWGLKKDQVACKLLPTLFRFVI